MSNWVKILIIMWLTAAGLTAAGQRVATIEHDTDLWTCGQLILFSSKEPVTWDEHGRVVSGMLGINTLILCADNKFREFARDYHVEFDERGLLVSGTPSVSVVLDLQEQTIMSQPYTEVAFYPNGVVRYLIPSDNFRFATEDGFKFSVMAGRLVYFDESGRLRAAAVARRRVVQKSDGTERVYQPGDLVRIDERGRVE